jgi:hypothetical protein
MQDYFHLLVQGQGENPSPSFVHLHSPMCLAGLCGEQDVPNGALAVGRESGFLNLRNNLIEEKGRWPIKMLYTSAGDKAISL